MSHPEYSPEELDALALYSLGLLEGDERSKLDEHLSAGCTHCESHIMEFRKTAASFVEHAAPLAVPPVTLRSRVLAVTDISALSSSPDSNSEPVKSAHSRKASSPSSDEGAPLENGSEPTPQRQMQEHRASDSDRRPVNSPRAYPPVKRVAHKPTRGKHLSAPRDGQDPSPEQQG
jgi:hypothetical protein